MTNIVRANESSLANFLEVPGHGPRNAKILFLGEAPAREELKKGEPFVGRAGKQLDSMLKIAGIDRESVYLTNSSLTPVTGEKKRFFFGGSGKPSSVFIRGMGQLMEDIQEIKPNVVVPLGNYALWTMMQHEAITKWRGSILKSELFGCKVVPTLHPAALLRGETEEEGGTKGGGGMWKMLTAVVNDLRRVKEQAKFPEVKLKHRKIIINPQGHDLDEALSVLMECEELVFDMETFGGTNLACAGFSPMDPYRAWVFECDNHERIGLVQAILENKKTGKIGHNICSYDVPMLDSVGIHPANITWDTMIAAHTLVPDLPKSLAFLTSIYTDIPYYKDEGKILGRIKTREDMIAAMFYCGKDNVSCAEIALAQKGFIRERGLEKVMERSMAIFGPLREAMQTGFQCDLKKLYIFAVSTERKLKLAQAELDELAGHPVNANSNSENGDVKRLLFQERKIAPRYKKGRLTADAHVLADIAARNGDPAPQLIIRVRQLSKRLSNYYNLKIVSPDRRIRTVYNIPGTKSKRLASSIPLWGPGVPMQTIPGNARSMFVADEGYEILECDQAQAEAVVVAYLANDPIHMDCFRTGKDVHRVTAALLNGMEIDDWIKIPKKSQVRQLAKTCNHELNYNAGPFMFMLTVNEEYDPDDPLTIKLNPDTSRVIWHRYHNIRPALGGYWKTIQYELRHNNMTLKSPLGWEFQFLDKWSDSMLNLAYSWKPQNTVGESTNIGILQVMGLMAPPFDKPELYSAQDDIKHAGVKFSAQIHDSGVFQVPKEAVDELAPKIMRLMEVPLWLNGYNICVPVEGMAGPTWDKSTMRDMGKTRETVEL